MVVEYRETTHGGFTGALAGKGMRFLGTASGLKSAEVLGVGCVFVCVFGGSGSFWRSFKKADRRIAPSSLESPSSSSSCPSGAVAASFAPE